jgi:hypothetical protein
MLLHVPIANWRGVFLNQTIYIQGFLSSKKTNKEKELNIEYMLSGMHSGMGTCLGEVLESKGIFECSKERLYLQGI